MCLLKPWQVPAQRLQPWYYQHTITSQAAISSALLMLQILSLLISILGLTIISVTYDNLGLASS